MLKPLVPALAASLLLGAASAAAPAALPAPAPAPAPAASDPALDAHLAFVGEVGRVTADQIGAMRTLVDAKPLLDTLATPAGMRANGPEVRALVVQARRALVGIGERLKGIAAPDTRFAPVKPATMLAELGAQNAKMIALLGDYEALLLAAERGDAAGYARLVPKVSSGAYVLLDSMRLAYRDRQSAVKPDRSAYQALGVGIHLYSAMPAAGRAWFNARLARQPAVAAAEFKKSIAGMAENLRALGRDGRANVTREMAQLDRAANGASPQEMETIRRLRLATGERAKLFDVGDEIAAWAERAEAVTPAQLAAAPQPLLMGQLIPLEMRFQTIAAAEAAIAAGRTP